jgi:hypothetical protein
MRLLTETTDINAVDHIRFLLESNGIPIFVGNEDTARNAGYVPSVGKQSVFVIYDEQFYDAQCLLKDENHEVQKKIDMDEFRKNMELIKPNALDQLVKGALAVVGIVAVLFGVFILITNVLNK